MDIPSHADAFEVLCLQIAADGRDAALLGDSADRARKAARPFAVGSKCPDFYFEFPLSGTPFLDVTLLYGSIEPGTRIDSPAAEGTGAMLDFYAGLGPDYDDACCGFELDTKNPLLPAAAVHFQPRRHTELVEPFCEVIGEPERARLYLDLDARMPDDWRLSFFGMFRGRPRSPLRVCGYLDDNVKAKCAGDSRYLASVFDDVGFRAYDDAMLDQASALMRIAPGTIDFQLDVFPDGSIGPTFAFDLQFEIQRPELVRASFADGPVARTMRQLETWGAADGRWKLAAEGAFARGIPVELDDGETRPFAFTLIPQWAKARWTDGALQPAKFYLLGHAGVLEQA